MKLQTTLPDVRERIFRIFLCIFKRPWIWESFVLSILRVTLKDSLVQLPWLWVPFNMISVTGGARAPAAWWAVMTTSDAALMPVLLLGLFYPSIAFSTAPSLPLLLPWKRQCQLLYILKKNIVYIPLEQRNNGTQEFIRLFTALLVIILL